MKDKGSNYKRKKIKNKKNYGRCTTMSGLDKFPNFCGRENGGYDTGRSLWLIRILLRRVYTIEEKRHGSIGAYGPVAERRSSLFPYKNDWNHSTFHRTLAIFPLSCKRAFKRDSIRLKLVWSASICQNYCRLVRSEWVHASKSVVLMMYNVKVFK